MIIEDRMILLYRAVDVYCNHSGTHPCFNLSNHVNDAHGAAGWIWQACTELVEPQIENSNDSLFPSAYRHQHKLPSMVCNEDVKPRPHWITIEFGGHDMRRVQKRFGSNTILYNGQRDPISAGGVLESISKSIVAIVAPEGAHGADLSCTRNDDPKWHSKFAPKIQ